LLVKEPFGFSSRGERSTNQIKASDFARVYERILENKEIDACRELMIYAKTEKLLKSSQIAAIRNTKKG